MPPKKTGSKKGDKSKTHKGDLDYTTKRGDKDFHQKGHDVKKKRRPYTKDNIDWDNIKWGSFTAQFNRYRSTHPRTRHNTLEKFARYIIKNKKKFTLRTFRRANFYVNVILGRKKK